ncbi:hypothetical protein P22_3686 [Propionispora sp. 2/2-37]|uniref:peptidase MA family metallohydrolase n=1 Tax=Propionispora sp. 2/2-37 TaxID=1677858 RepID=UPI0006BB8895|nr:hypothetical protein [Propionispora sp. 2/2-37]CUH97555.1 hypothetical protein P22_3686 [Propionispora sp. 2/2-37]
MRMLGTQQDIGVFSGIVGLILAVLLFVHLPSRPQAWLYSLARQAAQIKIEYETRYMEKWETEHFVIKYTPEDEAVLPLVAEAAEQAYRPVTTLMGHTPPAKTLVVIYPDKAKLRQVFGWSQDQSAMGVYWGGVIQVLSPQVWLQDDKDQLAQFIRTGPMVHEYTHLVFDHMTHGNYTRWFTEGLAQYVEYKVNGYEWITPYNNLNYQLYTMAELDNSFDDLGNQSLAYRESLAAIRYIAEVHGEDKLQAVIAGLQDGKTTEQAITQALGMSYEQFAEAWPAWMKQNMKYDAESAS